MWVPYLLVVWAGAMIPAALGTHTASNRDVNNGIETKPWREEFVVRPLMQSSMTHHPGQQQHVLSSEQQGSSIGTLVLGTFVLSGIKLGTRDMQYVHAGIHEMMVYRNVHHMHVTYIRGNRGNERHVLPRWYPDAPPGLHVNLKFRSAHVEYEELQSVMRVLTKMVGSSAPTIVNRGGFVEMKHGNSTHVWGASTQDFPCVESIAAWMKLLPCGGQRGLSRVIKLLPLLDMPYHGIQIRAGLHGEILNIAIDIIGRSNALGYPASSWSRRAQAGHSLYGIFKNLGAILEGSNDDVMTVCPLTKGASQLYLLKLPHLKYVDGCSGPSFRATQSSWYSDGNHDEEYLLCLESQRRLPCPLQPSMYIDISNNILWKTASKSILNIAVKVRSWREENSMQVDSLTMKIFQFIPWEIPAHAKTLRIYEEGNQIFPSTQYVTNINIKQIQWKPPRKRFHGSMLEVTVGIGPSMDVETLLHIQIDVERRLLSVFDYPPDVSRGMDIPAPWAELRAYTVGHGEGHSRWNLPSLLCSEDNLIVSGQNLEVQLPIPDASMPFNVTCFTATLFVLIFGSVVNLTVWSSDELQEIKEKSKNGMRMKKIVRFILVVILGGGSMVYLDPSIRAQTLNFLDKVVSFVK